MGLPPNGFQDRLVMTASIPLRICNCLSTEIIRYSIVLEILLEMRFCATVGVPKKSGVARLFTVFATAVLANFQDRLVMTASITLRRLPAHIRSRPGNKDYYTTKPGGCQVKFPKNGQQSMISTKTATRDAQKNRPTASPTRIFISVSGIVSPPFGFRETRLCAYCLRFIVFYA